MKYIILSIMLLLPFVAYSTCEDVGNILDVKTQQKQLVIIETSKTFILIESGSMVLPKRIRGRGCYDSSSNKFCVKFDDHITDRCYNVK